MSRESMGGDSGGVQQAHRRRAALLDGRVRGVRDLYVPDASAFPAASGLNPMLSIMALARRTAARMAANWRSRPASG